MNQKKPITGAVRAGMVVFCAFGIYFNLLIAESSSSQQKKAVDFAQFYSAGQLAGTGHLYDVPAIEKLERQYTSVVGLTARLPVVALAYKPLTWLSFFVAFGVWLVLSVLAGGGGLCLWPELNPWAAAIAFCWSVPACITLFFGQDVLFWLGAFALGLWLLAKDRAYLAGIAFSLCICKFHLLFGLPVMLIAARRWKTVASGCVCAAILLGLSFAVEGGGWPSRYWKVTRLSEFDLAVGRMPTIYGVVYRLPQAWILEVIACLLIAVMLCAACRKTDIGLSGALAAAAGLLMAHHAFGYDCVLLLPLCAWMVSPGAAPRWLRLPAIVLLSPAFLTILASNRPWIAQILVVFFVMGCLLWVVRGSDRKAIEVRPVA